MLVALNRPFILSDPKFSSVMTDQFTTFPDVNVTNVTTVRVTPGVDRKSCLNAFFNQDRLNRLKFLPGGCLTDIIDKIINATPNDDNSTTSAMLEMDQIFRIKNTSGLFVEVVGRKLSSGLVIGLGILSRLF